MRRPACWWMLALLSIASGVQAHTTKISYSSVRVGERTVHYTLAVSPHDLAVLVGLAGPQDPLVPLAAFLAAKSRLAAAMRAGIRVENAGESCLPGAFTLETVLYPQTLRLRTTYRCASPLTYLTITFALFFAIDPRHKNLGTLHLPDRVEEFLFTAALPEFSIDIAVATAVPLVRRVLRFLTLGITHIFTGYDHVLFLLALLLAGGRLRYLIEIVSAFTVAHSLTLVLATLGVITVPERLVEAVIALSIAYVAIENCFIQRLHRRWMVAFLFGLVHGFGFYSVLRALRLPQQGLALALFSFNFGVEVGQVVIVMLCYPALAFLASYPWHDRMVAALSLIIFGLGMYWFVQRAFWV